MKRTFIAIHIHPDEKLIGTLEDFKNLLSGEKIKWVDGENLHITLAFLGDTDEKIIPDISGIISQMAVCYSPFELVFRDAGVFRNFRDPKVIWIGTETNPVLQDLKSQLDIELSGFGFEKDDREFHPHLTLGRIKQIRNIPVLQEIILKYKNQQVHREQVQELIFYESILKPEGPVYIPLLNVPFRGNIV